LERGTECPYPYDLLVWREKYEAVVDRAIAAHLKNERNR
jgi:hypothetical protein